MGNWLKYCKIGDKIARAGTLVNISHFSPYLDTVEIYKRSNVSNHSSLNLESYAPGVIDSSNRFGSLQL